MLTVQKNRLYLNRSYLCRIQGLKEGKYMVINKQDGNTTIPYIEELGLFIGTDVKVGRCGDDGFKPVETYVYIIKEAVRSSGKITLWVYG